VGTRKIKGSQYMGSRLIDGLYSRTALITQTNDERISGEDSLNNKKGLGSHEPKDEQGSRTFDCPWKNGRGIPPNILRVARPSRGGATSGWSRGEEKKKKLSFRE